VAQGAADLCEDGDSIILNAGSTTWFMAQCLRQHRMQVLTNSFPHRAGTAWPIREPRRPAGGRALPRAGIILSPFDDDAIQHFAASKMFMSCYSITPLGIIESDPLVARAEAKLLSRTES
jgi:DeoR family ulaG and ulaABCDEF operon transcriptional repressor